MPQKRLKRTEEIQSKLQKWLVGGYTSCFVSHLSIRGVGGLTWLICYRLKPPNITTLFWTLTDHTLGILGEHRYSQQQRLGLPGTLEKGEPGTFSDLPAVGLQSWAMFSLDTSLRMLWDCSVYMSQHLYIEYAQVNGPGQRAVPPC
jgi:hypothetical protein